MSKEANVKVKLLSLDDIKPYPNNPRDNEAAVVKVMKSIERYGYINPIIVDKYDVVIAGHTRLKALKNLKYKEVQVVELDIPQQKAKELRIIDNKAAEYAEWTNDLIFELREIIDPEVLTEFFPEVRIDDEWQELDVTTVSNEDIAKKQSQLENKFKDGFEKERHDPNRVVKTECPHCGEIVSVLRSDITSGNLIAKEKLKNDEA